MRAFFQRGGAVEHVTGVLHDLGAALGVELLAFFQTLGFGDHVGAVERVVQAAPTGVGGVERVAGVQDRHDQLRACLGGQFVVHVFGRGFDLFGLGHEVADFFQEGLVSGHVLHWAGVGFVPSVELVLQAVTLGQQGDVLRGEVGHDGVKARPEL